FQEKADYMNSLLKSKYLFIIILILFFQSCAREEVRYRPEEVVAPGVHESPIVRVLIVENSDRANIESKVLFFSAMNLEGKVGKKFGGRGKYSVTCGRGYVRLIKDGKFILRAEKLFVDFPSKGLTLVNGKPYRGSLQFSNRMGSGFSVINFIGLDDYLKGVLPVEIGYLDSESYEAYRAQAIASRSYALSKLKKTKEKEYDLRATIMDQVYSGVAGENLSSTRAVEETAGLVAMWRGEPVKAYYSSCCGGHTSDIRFLWPWKEHFPYLYGVRDARGEESKRSFCRGSAHFRWRVSWLENKLVKILRKSLKNGTKKKITPFRKLVDLRAGGFAPDGRVKYLDVITDTGKYRIYGDRIRWVLRPESPDGAILKSTLFKLSVKRDREKVVRVDILGGGNGHGVGMCQTGAIKMAKLGYNAEEIILHYYPGVVIKKVY
ncbi:SpoIID/LytB domain-containing protein, partial [bacterium]|nr:SpoIID/LytB domain-containing protein [bacterium]